MIKLSRHQKPIELTSEVQLRLTEEYKTTRKAVWNLPYIKKALLSFSYNKCSYCETDLQVECKYIEVEHFHPKGLYENEVLDWENLLPSCKKCNCTKKDHDTISEPIIDPSLIDPKLHLKSGYYRIQGKDDLGKLTVSVLDLNNADRLVIKRFEIGNAVISRLEELNHRADDYISSQNKLTISKNLLVQGIKSLLREGLPSSTYSATTGCVILNDNGFLKLKEKITSLNLWDNELQGLEDEVRKVAFDQWF